MATKKPIICSDSLFPYMLYIIGQFILLNVTLTEFRNITSAGKTISIYGTNHYTICCNASTLYLREHIGHLPFYRVYGKIKFQNFGIQEIRDQYVLLVIVIKMWQVKRPYAKHKLLLLWINIDAITFIKFNYTIPSYYALSICYFLILISNKMINSVTPGDHPETFSTPVQYIELRSAVDRWPSSPSYPVSQQAGTWQSKVYCTANEWINFIY